MKICWDNLEGMLYIGNNTFRKNKRYSYLYIDSCLECGEPYLTCQTAPSDYCSMKCSIQNISKETRRKMSKAQLGRKHSEETKAKIGKYNKGKLNYFYKGGVKKKGLPLYDTYSSQIGWVEETRCFVNDQKLKLLEVRCSKCGKWFVPKLNNVKDRIKFLNGQRTAEALFYCSKECKNACPIFWKAKYPDGYNPRKYRNESKFYTEAELAVWSKEVLERAKYKCEICGKKAEHAHHIQPKKLEPGLALDPDNGLAVCEECHYKYGHKDECSTVNLANISCKGDN